MIVVLGLFSIKTTYSFLTKIIIIIIFQQKQQKLCGRLQRGRSCISHCAKVSNRLERQSRFADGTWEVLWLVQLRNYLNRLTAAENTLPYKKEFYPPMEIFNYMHIKKSQLVNHFYLSNMFTPDFFNGLVYCYGMRFHQKISVPVPQVWSEGWQLQLGNSIKSTNLELVNVFT